MAAPNTVDDILLLVTLEPSGCWKLPWAPRGNGYSRLSFGGKQHYGHRWMYERFRGPVEDGLELDHLCRDRACCNPDHLEPVTHAENVRRGDAGKSGLFWEANALKTHCKSGHPFDEKNTHWRKTGGRTCRTCVRLNARRRRGSIGARVSP